MSGLFGSLSGEMLLLNGTKIDVNSQSPSEMYKQFQLACKLIRHVKSKLLLVVFAFKFIWYL